MKSNLTHFRLIFHIWINQVIGFYYQNVPSFFISGTLVENGLMMVEQIIFILLTITQIFIKSEMGESLVRYVTLFTILNFSKGGY